MAGQHLSLVGQLGQRPQALDDLHHAATFQVGAAYRQVEKGVAREQDVLVHDMEADRPSGMPGCMDHMKGVVTEADLVAIGQQSAWSGEGVGGLGADEQHRLLWQLVHQRQVVFVHLWR